VNTADTLIRRIVRTLTRFGALVAGPEEEPAQPYLNFDRSDDDALASLKSASVPYRIAVGPIAGRKTLSLQIPGAADVSAGDKSPLIAGIKCPPNSSTGDIFQLCVKRLEEPRCSSGRTG